MAKIDPRDLILMQPFEVVEETIRRDSAEVSGACEVSQSQVNKWKERPKTKDEPDNSGSANPLQRTNEIIQTIKKIDEKRAMLPIWWLCLQNGLVPPIKLPDVEATDRNILKAILEWHKEVGETCNKLNASLEDGKITGAEYNETLKELFEDLQKGMAILFLFKERVR